MEGVHSRSFIQGGFAATNDQVWATRDLNAGSTSAEDKFLHKEGVGAWIIRKIEHIFFAVMGFFGSTWAQFRLGILYLEDSNQEEGLYWVKKSAENENITAQLGLGEIFHTGKYGVKIDKTVASTWLEKVVAKKVDKSVTNSQLDEALLRLANIYLEPSGYGIRKHPQRALELLTTGGAIERKNGEALRMAGEILKDRYSSGKGGAIDDLEKAVEFLTEAQDLGCEGVDPILDEALRLRNSAKESIWD